VVMIAFVKGTAPILAIQTGRRAIPGHIRPSFQRVEDYCKSRGAPPAEETPAEAA